MFGKPEKNPQKNLRNRGNFESDTFGCYPGNFTEIGYKVMISYDRQLVRG